MIAKFIFLTLFILDSPCSIRLRLYQNYEKLSKNLLIFFILSLQINFICKNKNENKFMNDVIFIVMYDVHYDALHIELIYIFSFRNMLQTA